MKVEIKLIRRIGVIIVFTIVFTPVSSTRAWEYKPHMRMNSDAVDTLPAGMKKFFEIERNFISGHAGDPIKWKRDAKSEMGWKQMNSASYDLGRYWVTARKLAGKSALPE